MHWASGVSRVGLRTGTGRPPDRGCRRGRRQPRRRPTGRAAAVESAAQLSVRSQIPTAVDVDRLARDVSRVLRTEECACGGDVLARAEAAHGRAGSDTAYRGEVTPR